MDDVKDIVEVLRQLRLYFSTFYANLSFLITMFFMIFYEVDYVKDIVEVLSQDIFSPTISSRQVPVSLSFLSNKNYCMHKDCKFLCDTWYYVNMYKNNNLFRIYTLHSRRRLSLCLCNKISHHSTQHFHFPRCFHVTYF